MSDATQTVWAETLVGTLADAGVTLLVLSPGSRSTPLACAAPARLEVVTIIDERAAAFFALGAARATGRPVALACTSGTAAAHYLPAIVEASLASVPLITITADRPPELHACGASQTIDQRALYGSFTRLALDLGAPFDGGLVALRRMVIQAVTASLGPIPGPVHLNAPFRKPLEPIAHDVEIPRTPALVAPPHLAADPLAVAKLARAIAATPDGVIVVGARDLHAWPARADLLALSRATGYPIIAESGSQLRFGPTDGAVVVDRFDLIPVAHRPRAAIEIQLGAEPVATPALACDEKWVLTDGAWRDPDSSATAVIAGRFDLTSLRGGTPDAMWAARWRALDDAAGAAFEVTVIGDGEHAAIRDAIAALPDDAIVQVGNSLPIRVIDHAAARGAITRDVITQRGAAGIDGLVASAAGAAHATKRPTLLVLGDVSFAHDVGALLVARGIRTPLAILVIDNRGGQIFAGLPIARATDRETLDAQFLTPTQLDPVAIATAFGVRATSVRPGAIAIALSSPGATVLHAPIAADGARVVRAAALAAFSMPRSPRIDVALTPTPTAPTASRLTHLGDSR